MKKRPIWTDRMPRWWNHGRAIISGYFWKPCPRCGAWFGGHEVRPPPEGGYMVIHGIDPRMDTSIPCPDCDADDFVTWGELQEMLS